MRLAFREWYAPTPEELKKLWENGTIILDSNVLLDLYLYPPETLSEFFKVLEKIKARLWLPNQAGLEYHRNRDKSLPQQRAVLERLIRTLEELAGNVDTLGLPEFHPVLNLATVEAGRLKIRESFEPVLQEVRDALAKTPEFKAESILRGEPVRDRLTQLFDGNVGAEFAQNELEQIYKEGDERYLREQPPGYKDRTKESPSRYGDLVLWKQILRNQAAAAGDARGALFVTNDRKEDWWLRKEKLLLGPRPELVREYRGQVGADFFIYTPSDFIKDAPSYLAMTVSAAAVAEVKRISETSLVSGVLRAQRMFLPSSSARVSALSHVYDAFAAGKIRRAGDLNGVIESLGESFTSNYVEAPLFFSLISESYGPFAVDQDPTIRLRDRSVVLKDSAGSKDDFIKTAHAAWLAQALYRLRYEDFTEDDLLVSFFGDDYPSAAPTLLDHARRLVEEDRAFRGR